MAAKAEKPTKFGPTFKGHFPEEMRRQLWPLCCGASILSGFKNIQNLTDAELVQQIEDVIKAVPDFQVFQTETMTPKMTFLTLNSSQMGSAKIMKAIKAAGFFEVGRGTPRGQPQGFFLRDTSNSWKATPAAVAA